jgi:hypothetical protein
MKNIVFFVFLYAQLLNGQITFNKRMYFGQPYANLTSIISTDSCFYATGVITDTLNASYKLGNVFVKFDLSGDTVFTKKLLSSAKYYQTWLGDMISTTDSIFIDIGQTSDSLIKAIIIRYSQLGDTLSTHEYLSPYNPENPFILPFEIILDKHERIVILNDIEKANGDNNISLAFFDSQFNLVSHKIYGNQFDEIPGDLILDGDGGFIIGANRDNTNFVDNNFWSYTYLIKTDSLGNIKWEYLSPPNYIQDIARGLVKSTDGGLVVATCRGFEHPINIEAGQLRWESAYFFKLDENQELVWELEVFDSITASPGNSLDRLIPVDSGMAYVAAGDFIFTKSLDPPDGGRYGWIMKISDEGELLWIRKYNIAESVGHSHRIYDLKQTSDGGFIIAGQATGAAPPGEPPSQAWLLKLDSFGCLIPGCQWQDTVTVSEQPGKAAQLPASQPASHPAGCLPHPGCGGQGRKGIS